MNICINLSINCSQKYTVNGQLSPRVHRAGGNSPRIRTTPPFGGGVGYYTVGRRRDSEMFERVPGVEDLLHEIEFPMDNQVSSDQFKIGKIFFHIFKKYI